MVYTGAGGVDQSPKTEIARRATTQDRLERRKKELEEELRAVNEAIALFGKHPEISEALDLLQRTNY